MASKKNKPSKHEKQPVEQLSFLSRFGWNIPTARLRDIAGIILLLLGALTLLTLMRITRGTVGDLWANSLRALFGWGAFALPLMLGGAGAFLLWRSTGLVKTISWGRVFAAEIFFAACIALIHLGTPTVNTGALAQNGEGGGFVGYAISTGLASFIGDLGTGVVLVLFALLALPGLVGLNSAKLRAWSDTLATRAEQTQPKRVRPARLERLPEEEKPVEPKARMVPPPSVAPIEKPSGSIKQTPAQKEEPAPIARPTFGAKPPTVKPPTIQHPILTPRARARRRALVPSLEILDAANEAKYSSDEAQHLGDVIVKTLEEFGVPVELLPDEIRIGPTITQFGLKPGFVDVRTGDGKLQPRKVPVNRIVNLQHDLELALARAPIRIEAPVPGRPIVGVEVPNQSISVVSLRGVMETEGFTKKHKKSQLAIALGRDVSGEGIATDLASMPHLLIAGATGSGKSVCINAIIACLLFENSPDDLRMIMVDPKRVELVNFNGIPHLLGPVVVNSEEVVPCLRWLTQEMDHRFTLFAQEKVRNVDAFNDKRRKEDGDTMPYIIALIDELADLMLAAPEETEKQLTRLAQMARATGIHLVIATQRPSVDVVTGLIKANFPSRISFAVTSSVDSRVVLDTPGAEKLLGKGDMLYMASDSSKLERMQGCFVSDDELKKLVDFWREKAITDMRDIPKEPPWKNVSDAKEGSDDDLTERAIEIARGLEHLSISYLQRKLEIGYPRAARLMDDLQERGIVGPDEGGGKGRRVTLEEEPVQEPRKKKK